MSSLDHRSPLPESRPWYRSRWTGAAVVALVHVVLIGFVLLSTPRTIELIPSPREIYYVFHPKPPQKLPVHIGPPPVALRPPPRFEYAPRVLPRAITVLPPTKDLGLSLFACAPENLANLTAQERAHCTNALTMAALQGPLPGGLTMHAVHGDRWEQQVAEREEPAAVPCTKSQKLNDGNGGSAVFVDALCAWDVLDKALR
ncbi:MAG: hypothetical protein ISS15_08100 [Alphaproteobacteria bacterium]|nr:hypothetical protein [Alphaproteobacteria bacterium]MBL6936833.1 hypothetical protein [Alphaproteobacteria bacterium]MBL7097602.1 hypothetical protein [Alphaproteobacteria bacterium]